MQDKQKQINYVKADSLIGYARNSKQHTSEQIAKLVASIVEFGWTFPILADDKGIVAGHGRRDAALRLYEQGKTIYLPNGEAIPDGMVPVIDCTGWSEAKRKAYIIADNKLPDVTGSWDFEMLSVELDELNDAGFDIDLLGFSPDEISELIGNPHSGEGGGLTDDDATPEPPETPVTVLGDVWLLGKHRLMCGDSTSIDEIAKLCEGRHVDMWLTDPPYNVAYEGGTKDKLTIVNDEMSDEKFREFLRDAYVAADASMKAGAVFYIWHADSEGYNFRGACRDVGWKVRQTLIWHKSQLVMGRQDYHWKHEPCLYGWKDGAGHLWSADRKQTTVLEFDKPQRNGEHPTMKPVALFEYQMLNNTKGGDLVLDSFGGLGTTMIAAEKNGRHARLMELDPKYCDVIVKRWQEYTGKVAVRESDGVEFNQLCKE